MNTYLTRWLVVCIALCSLGLSYTVQDLMDPTFQPYEDRDINMWERARLIDELKAQEAAQDSEEPASNEATLSPTEAAAIEAKIARDLKESEMLKAKLAEQKALEDSKGPELGIPFEEYQENLNTEIQDVYPTKEPSDYDSINIQEPCSPEYGCGEEAKAAWEAKVAAENRKAAREEARLEAERLADKEASEALGLDTSKSHVEVAPISNESPRTRDALYFNDFSAGGLTDGFSKFRWWSYICIAIS